MLKIIKRNKVATGIKELDIILEGGFDKGNVLIKCSTGKEARTSFAVHLATGRNEKMDNEGITTRSAFVCLDSSPEEIRNEIRRISSTENTEITYIDANTGKVEKKKHLIGVGGPGNLNEISLAIKEFLDEANAKDGDKRIIFFSLSKIFLTVHQISAIKFMKLIAQRVKEYGATAFYFIDTSAHDENTVMKIERICDYSIELETRVSDGTRKTYLYIQKPYLEIPIKISMHGIQVI